MDVEIGRNRTAKAGYDLRDVSIVPSRRTRDPELVSLDWQVDAYKFALPLLASPMDSVVSPDTAVTIGQLGGVGVLNLAGVWTRYDDPTAVLAEISAGTTTARMREIYAAPIQEDLIAARIKTIKDSGVITAASLTPQLTREFADVVVRSGVDLFVIQGLVTSAEHVSAPGHDPLNLKRFISDLDVPVIVGGCATYMAALHLMRTGAAGILAGIGAGAVRTTSGALGVGVPTATAIAEVAAARRDYLDETGGRYVQVIADGGMADAGDIAKAIACGADAVMIGRPLAHASDAPGLGRHWGMTAAHPTMPRGTIVDTPARGTLSEVLTGPATSADGTTNLFGGLRRAMAATGYSSLKEFQKVELSVHA